MQEKDRARLLRDKTDSIHKMLVNWAKQYDILNPGERITFVMLVETIPTVVGKTREQILALPVEFLKLSTRAQKGCKRAVTRYPCDETTIGELISLSAKELISRSKNFGITSLNEVRYKLQQLGLRLREDEDKWP